MKKVILALYALASVNIQAMKNEEVKFFNYMSNLKAGKHYSINAQRALDAYAPLRDDETFRSYHRLKNKNGEVLSEGICQASICKFKAPSRGAYALTIAYNKKLQRKISDYLSKKYGKPIKSRPILLRRIKVNIE